jgi:hypothetical protein
MRVIADRTQVDIFIAYDFNQTHRSVGYHQGRHTATYVANVASFLSCFFYVLFFLFFLSRLVPKFNKFCTGDVLGHKLMVPCDPVAYLDFEYNPREKWTVPTKKFIWWSNMLYKQYYWPDPLWPHAYKSYFPNGTFDRNRSLRGINNQSKKKIKDIIFKDDEIKAINY